MDSKITSNITTSLTYKLINFQNYDFYMMNLIDSGYLNEIAAGINYISIHTALDEIYDANKESFFNKIDESKFLITI